MRFRILATPRSFCKSTGPHHDYLRENGCDVDLRAQEHPLTAEQLRELIPGYHGAILGLDQCDASVFERADRLRVISRYGAGVDQVDIQAASRLGIVVTNAPGANSLGVIELCIGLMFSLARSIPQVANAARNGVWQRAPGIELSGKTLGVIGFGTIGRGVANRAQALGMRVLAHDPYWQGDTMGAQLTDLATLLRESDFVSLHCALTPETERLINPERIAGMRDSAYLINTARGGLVDESALADALRNGKLAGAAADVFHDDPPAGSPLIALENFIATPHIGATTREAVQRTSMMAAQNLVAVLRGEPCPNIVNADALGMQRR
jgi:D-3-phosphoglycerate dehydrogenase